LPLSDDDIRKIKSYGRKLKENKLIIDNNYYMRCPFLNFKNECDIYENRPLICKNYDCEQFNNNTHDKEFIDAIKTKNFRIINIREYFFGGKK
jgi:Fe-S-cluster containining protein